MRIPVRILRATADNRHPPPPPTARTREREERILAVNQTIMAEHGPETFTFADLALTLRIDRATLRRHFPDLESLLGKILRRHLNRVTRAVAEIHPDDPDRDKKRRSAYHNATHTPLGGLNEAHLLLIRNREMLPDDLLPAIEASRLNIGSILAGPLGEQTLAELDKPGLDTTRIEPAPPPVRAEPPKPPAITYSPGKATLLARGRATAAANFRALARPPPPQARPGPCPAPAGAATP